MLILLFDMGVIYKYSFSRNALQLICKAVFMFSIILIFETNGLAQKFIVFEGDTVNLVDALNKKQGTWMNFGASGKKVIEKGNYINDKKEGLWTAYFPNGNIKHEITFKSGIANGPAKFYYEDGKVWEQGTWMFDHWVGNYQFFYPSGQIAYDWNYNATGKRTGVQKYYHENGNVKYEGDWENGKTTGALKMYDQDGKLSGERIYAQGKFQQTINYNSVEQSHDNSGRMNTARFTGSGYHTIYNMDGHIAKKGLFEKGQLINGEQYVYDGDGKLSSVLIFENGALKETRHEE